KDHTTIANPLIKEKTDQGVKSYHQIKVDDKENKQEMQENLAVEKKQHVEKVHSDLSSIEYGETSEHVENVQEALASYDNYEGEIDGIYGTMTETARKEAEQDNALPERIQTEQPTASNEEENDENTASSEEEETNSEENNEETEGTEQDEEISEEAVSLEVENDSTD